MPKVAAELSAIQVRNLEQGVHAVGGVPGLLLSVSPTLAKTWVLRVRVAGKRREMGLGGYPGVTLAQARERARHYREDIDKGRDPIAERIRAKAVFRAQQAADKTFEQCARTYVQEKGGEWSNSKHRAQWLATLEKYAFPVIGRLPVSEVNLTHIRQILLQTQPVSGIPLWEAKTETAVRLRGRVESILDWATVHQYRHGLNPARWKGHLEALLLDPNKIKNVKHHPALPFDEIGAFMSSLRGQQGTGALALEFAILTASRSGEVRGAKWSEIDMKSGVWVIPAERMKAKKEHRVPLSTQAFALLRSITPTDGNPLVFPAQRGGLMSDMTLTAVLRRMKVQAVPHGFRSSFRDWAAEMTTYPKDLCEFALAHTLDNKTEAAYLRSDMLDRRRALMQDWADYCDKTKA
jgi:integrase